MTKHYDIEKPKILIVEDDTAICNLISTAIETIETKDYDFHTAKTGMDAISEAISYTPDVILLDLGLPDIDGVEIITKVRSWSNVPIIVVSARGDDKDKILALDRGADDYIQKPFCVEELLARIRAFLRRVTVFSEQSAENPVFVNGGLKIEYASGCAYINESQLHLSPIEYKLLCLLAKNVGKVLTHVYIMNDIWGSRLDVDVSALRVFMAGLRKKIESDSAHPQYIQTHIGVGYRMIKVE